MEPRSGSTGFPCVRQYASNRKKMHAKAFIRGSIALKYVGSEEPQEKNTHGVSSR